MRLAETVTFGGSGLDRAAPSRATALEALNTDRARVVPLWRGKPSIARPDGAGPHIAWLTGGHAALGNAPVVFLGMEEEGPRYAADLSGWTPAEAPEPLDAFADPSEQVHPDIPGAAFIELRRVMALLSPREAEFLATARALLGWHATHRFCACCGAGSVIAEGGWQRVCPNCDARHFPRTDPVVIMLITHGNEVLLGRSPGWPEGMFSLLAGFVEPGETIEAAVRRETFEETGIRVGAVTYLASQPWPFPSSLMLGCRGEALGREIVLDPAELDDACWMSREALVGVFSGADRSVLPAREGAIARFLIHHWLADLLD